MNYYQPSSENHIDRNIYKTPVDGVLYVKKTVHDDERGFFAEIARIPEIESITGEPFSIRQINHARSKTNVVRGIHAEGWNKLVFVPQGTCFCAIADVRESSPTYKFVVYFKLGKSDDALKGSLYLPSGVGNSICVLDGPVDYVYGVDRLYADRDPAGDAAISLFDPTLNIEWPIPREQMILSDRDVNGKML
ncbi:dTDP-4-dehydrorhamnose 3,5-epimerase family protein [Candidatus Woesebacteria bacterium]|nr:dTDP-4-dehydrorhamnose 3,5-epimerase family protein [Candidatus Woesebacteria bacterium]